MKQTSRSKHLEVIANQAVGLVIGWLLVRFAFPLMGVEVSNTQATISSAMFFAASYVRLYIIRSIADHLNHK